jgi:hypothetical protein
MDATKAKALVKAGKKYRCGVHGEFKNIFAMSAHRRTCRFGAAPKKSSAKPASKAKPVRRHNTHNAATRHKMAVARRRWWAAKKAGKLKAHVTHRKVGLNGFHGSNGFACSTLVLQNGTHKIDIATLRYPSSAESVIVETLKRYVKA